MSRRFWRHIRKLLFPASVLLALLTRSALAQGRPTPTGATQDASPKQAPGLAHGVSYAGGQLALNLVDVSLAEVLARIATLTAVKIDLPQPSDNTRLQVVKLGPGSPREVLVELLSDSHLNYVIESSDTDPGKLQSVLIMPEDKSSPHDSVGAEASANPYYRRNELSQMRHEQPPPESSEPAPRENAPPVESAATQEPAVVEPVQSAPRTPAQELQTSAARAGALSPPQVLNQENITQQLQQMYQQRAQIAQLQRAQGAPSADH